MIGFHCCGKLLHFKPIDWQLEVWLQDPKLNFPIWSYQECTGLTTLALLAQHLNAKQRLQTTIRIQP